jgi:hypothetical protein
VLRVSVHLDQPSRRSTGGDTPQQPGNKHGRQTALTLFTPINRRWLLLVRVSLWVSKWLPMTQKHILQFKFIHMVRWSVVKEFPQNGPPQDNDRLNYAYLFFESNFDGPWQHYIDGFAYCIPWDIRFLWGRGPAFPGPPPAEPLKKWIAENSMEGGTYYSAYPSATTKMVLGALAVRDGLRSLVAESASLDPEEFKARYQKFLVEAQAHL